MLVVQLSPTCLPQAVVPMVKRAVTRQILAKDCSTTAVLAPDSPKSNPASEGRTC